jgi:hypothetical protein
MSRQATTMRGKSLDMSKLAARNAGKIALGNASMNARGDVVGPGGVITIRREDASRDYHNKNPKAIKQMPLRSIGEETIQFQSPAEAIAQHKRMSEIQQKQPQIKRKIVDND